MFESLVETILHQMLAELEGNEAFQPQYIDRLRELVASGDLSKPQKVMDALTSEGEEQ